VLEALDLVIVYDRDRHTIITGNRDFDLLSEKKEGTSIHVLQYVRLYLVLKRIRIVQGSC